MELRDRLMKLGLTDKEAKVYLACLELGMGSAYKIADKAKIKRSTTYAILDQLMVKKMVSVIKKKTKKHYTVAHPKNLVDVWEEREMEFQKQKEELNKLISGLEAIYQTAAHKPELRFYQGVEGVQDIHNEILKDKKIKAIYYMASVQSSEELLGEKFYKNWIKKRVSLGIKAMGIRKKPQEVEDVVYTDKKDYLREYRFAPNWVNIPMEVEIFGNKVAIISSKKELFGFIVESQEFSLLMKSLFDVLWNISEEIETGN